VNLYGNQYGGYQKLKIDLPYDTAIPLLGIYPKEHKSTYKRDNYIPMFIVALFTRTKLWNQPSAQQK
jgi:hypothetical protein